MNHIEPTAEDFLANLPTTDLRKMIKAGDRISECYRVLEKGGLNIVGEVLKDQGTFYELDHYPSNDVFDRDHHSQYYYHAHRDEKDEHGHFHTFIRAPAINNGTTAASGFMQSEPWPKGDEQVSHLIAISMDSAGFPRSLFTTNRWVTDETWFNAADVKSFLPQFKIDHAWPSWPVNIWITSMLTLFEPQIRHLLDERDHVIELSQNRNCDIDILENRDLEISSQMPIDVQAWIDLLQTHYASSAAA